MESITHSPYWPFAVLALGIVAVVMMISRWRLHPFLALMLTAILVGLVSFELPGNQHHVIKAVEIPMFEFGAVAGKIAWVIVAVCPPGLFQ